MLPQIARALQDCNEPQQTRLRLAIECHSCIQWLTPALENFRARWPHVEVDFHSGVTFDPQPALQQGELDLVMTSDILPRSTCTTRRCLIFEVRLVLAPEHPLAMKTLVTPEDLAAETLLIYPVQRGRLDIWRHFLQPAGISPQLKSVDNTLLLIQMVAARMGIAALPHWVVESFERQGLVVTKTLGEGYGAGCTRPFAMANSVNRSPKRLFALRGTTPAIICRLSGVRSDPAAMDPQRGQDHQRSANKARPVRLLLPDGKVNQQPGGDMDVIHDPQRAGIHRVAP